MSYYTKITKAGLAAITATMNNNTKVPITYMAFGDGNGYIPEPDENADSLVNEVYRVGVNQVEVHSKNPNWLVCEAIIPSAVGGFNIREVALYDSTGNTMLAIASYPPTYKPTVEEGAAKIQTIRIIIQVDNSGNFELIVDPDVVLATVEYIHKNLIDSKIKTSFGRNQEDKNLETLTPYDFGAIGDGTSHKLSERYTTLVEAQAVYPHAVSLDDEIDWCALQSFANLYANAGANRKISFEMSGHFVVNRTLDFTIKATAATYSGAYKYIHGDSYFTVRPGFVGNTVIALNGRGSGFSGVIYIKGGKHVDYGIVLADTTQPDYLASIAFGQSLSKIFVDDVRIRAVLFSSKSMFAQADLIRGYGCGTSFDVTATSITNRSVNSLDKRTDIILSSDITLPDLAKVNVFVTRGSDVSKVLSYDSATRKLEVRHAFNDTSTAGKIKVFYGGLVGIIGSDSAGIKIGVCSGVYTPIVIENQAMYPVEVDEVVAEFTQCAIYDQGLVGGLNISSAYFEGDTWQYISNNTSAGVYGFTHIGKTTVAFNIDKCTSIAYPKNAAGYGDAAYWGLRGTRIAEKDIVHRYEKPAYNENGNNIYLDMNTPYEVFNRQFNSGGIQINPINLQYNKLFGYDFKQVVIHGTGVDAAPTGNIVFVPPSGWTINGSSSNATFSGFTGAAKFDVKLRPATNDINITCSNLQSTKKGTTAQRPSNPQIGTRYYDTTLLATGKPIEWNGLNWVDTNGTTV